ncbi:hypothetical protein ATANTOWER_022789 [Ataeniobius toweri]|uniref:Uncharacterized protein n=1 Tax=Ataeniobius toweri TaxID=208326 RepID=A0ABU7CCD7_9TELE|nr:hypothetical protein [Ataeniobius toweri]
MEFSGVLGDRLFYLNLRVTLVDARLCSQHCLLFWIFNFWRKVSYFCRLRSKVPVYFVWTTTRRCFHRHLNFGISVTCSPSNASTSILNSSSSLTDLSSLIRETSVPYTQTPNPSTPPLAVRLFQHKLQLQTNQQVEQIASMLQHSLSTKSTSGVDGATASPVSQQLPYSRDVISPNPEKFSGETWPKEHET